MTRRDRTVVAGRGNHGLEQRILGVLRNPGIGLTKGPLVVGFSGGPDSLALLVLLSHLRQILGRDLMALHVDHNLRAGSRDEALAAGKLAREFAVPLHVERLEPGLLARHPGVGTEEAARRERYRAAAAFCGAVGGSFVTAHHADDQAETVLLHLLRGSGLGGMGGMRTVTSLPVPWWNPTTPVRTTVLTVVRPLLDTRRSELERYLSDRRPDLTPVLDPTNLLDGYRRNAVRHALLPEVERTFPAAVEALNRFARIAAEESDLLDVIAGSALVAASDPSRRLSRLALAAQPVAIARRVIRRWFDALRTGTELSLERVEAVRELAASDKDRWSVEVGGGFSVRGDGDLLAVGPARPGGGPTNR
jgi:tRNA(Ile)-lysidine synthase